MTDSLQERVRAEYDALASVYEQRWSRYIEASTAATLRRIPRDAGERLLDVGCGTGVLLGRLPGRSSFREAVGIDLSPGMVAQARSRVPADVRFLVGDAEALPARHGPAAADRGPVIGFALAFADQLARAVYVSGDTVWFDQIASIAARLSVQVAILFMGAARVPAVGPAHLTFTAAEALEAARVFSPAPIAPLHFEGWAHFTESRREIAQTFGVAGLEHRLRWLEPGRPTELESG